MVIFVAFTVCEAKTRYQYTLNSVETDGKYQSRISEFIDCALLQCLGNLCRNYNLIII